MREKTKSARTSAKGCYVTDVEYAHCMGIESEKLPSIFGPVTLKDGTAIRPADMVNHPPHYTSGPSCPHCGNVIECITITERMDFCTGNAVKYIWRKDAKGSALEDLKKARWYLDREIQRMEAK